MTITDTPPFLADLFDFGDLEIALQGGYVREQNHPTLPLKILNYTEKAAYEGVWTPVTLQCRGLIVETFGEHRVVARPLIKFFNYSQEGAATIALDAPVHVLDKADGSLGILYPTPDGWAVATRGSFTSEQAVHATQLLRTRYPDFTPPTGMTVLVEIVYPANRIVVDYNGLDDLILLGAVGLADGAVYDPSWVPDWHGPVVESFAASTFADALALPVRSNAEGFVVRCLNTGAMLKIKYAEYVALHKIVTGLTARTVWEHITSGAPLDDLIAPLPDEFHDWVRKVANDITTTVERQHQALNAVYADALGDTRTANPGWAHDGIRTSRAAFAKVATSAHYRNDSWALFAILDGRDIRPELLKRAKPEPYVTPAGRTFSEDNS
jgi:RNA ligase